MGYRDDFYIPQYIIGFTGFLDKSPTVYFKHGLEFGRITQEHAHKNNIGRNLVRSDAGYQIVNNKGHAEEYYGGKTRHKSRHPFNSVNDKNRDILALTIKKFEKLKPKYK